MAIDHDTNGLDIIHDTILIRLSDWNRMSTDFEMSLIWPLCSNNAIIDESMSKGKILQKMLSCDPQALVSYIFVYYLRLSIKIDGDSKQIYIWNKCLWCDRTFSANFSCCICLSWFTKFHGLMIIETKKIGIQRIKMINTHYRRNVTKTSYIAYYTFINVYCIFFIISFLCYIAHNIHLSLSPL